jgi:hypothetical protein
MVKAVVRPEKGNEMMQIGARDRQTLRQLAERYSDIAHLDIQQQRIERYRKTNAMENVRPVVLIDEVPWGEIKDDALANVCAPGLGWLETQLRRTLYQWEHFQVDMVVPPVFRVPKLIRSTGIGISVQDTQIKGDTGTYASSHQYVDQLKTEADLAKLREPEISYDREDTEAAIDIANAVFDGLMDVKAVGCALHCNLWDQIAAYRGVESLLMDLAMRPEFMHQTVHRFAAIAESNFRQLEELGLLDAEQVLLHCTVGYSDELPTEDFDGAARQKDVWGRCAAQIFGSVSPEMHDEFDLAYNEKLFGGCGLVYYGCCEPMDSKIDILRKRFKNLRKISVTPWADPHRAAENMRGDYVMAAKPNPAFVASSQFNPEPVKEEISRYCEACRTHGTTVEFVLKDISTIARRPENLTQWAATVNAVIDKYCP